MAPNERQQTRIIYLVSGYINGTLTPEETAELDIWKDASPSNAKLFAELTDPGYRRETIADWTPQDTEISLERLKARRTPASRPKRLWWPYAAAMSLLLAIGVYFYMYQSSTVTSADQPVAVDDIDPGSNRAILRLADGSTVLLDDSGEGTIARQLGTTISKTGDGQLIYEVSPLSPSEGDAEVTYNTIEIPKGGQYQVRLPDGTQVWLNAASTLKYPVSFKRGDRRVELSGEAYFVVAHNKEQPFVVKTSQQQVKVLGTAFNINAYENEGVVTTTLQNGSIQLSGSSTANPLLLKPGEQAVTAGQGFRVQQVDVNDFTAWKDGLIVLNNADLPTVIRQIERWYDVEFVAPEVSGTVKVFGELRRNVKLSEVLNALREYYGLNFKIEGRRVIASR